MGKKGKKGGKGSSGGNGVEQKVTAVQGETSVAVENTTKAVLTKDTEVPRPVVPETLAPPPASSSAVLPGNQQSENEAMKRLVKQQGEKILQLTRDVADRDALLAQLENRLSIVEKLQIAEGERAQIATNLTEEQKRMFNLLNSKLEQKTKECDQLAIKARVAELGNSKTAPAGGVAQKENEELRARLERLEAENAKLKNFHLKAIERWEAEKKEMVAKHVKEMDQVEEKIQEQVGEAVTSLHSRNEAVESRNAVLEDACRQTEPAVFHSSPHDASSQTEPAAINSPSQDASVQTEPAVLNSPLLDSSSQAEPAAFKSPSQDASTQRESAPTHLLLTSDTPKPSPPHNTPPTLFEELCNELCMPRVLLLIFTILLLAFGLYSINSLRYPYSGTAELWVRLEPTRTVKEVATRAGAFGPQTIAPSYP